jgi:hypothetical protein
MVKMLERITRIHKQPRLCECTVISKGYTKASFQDVEADMSASCVIAPSTSTIDHNNFLNISSISASVLPDKPNSLLSFLSAQEAP